MWWSNLQSEIAHEFQRLGSVPGFLRNVTVDNGYHIGARRTIRGRWYVTKHAIDAYRKRVKKCTRAEALADLVAISNRAHFVKLVRGECELWRGPRTRIGRGRRTGGIRLIVGPGEGELPALLTVLGEHDDATAKEG